MKLVLPEDIPAKEEVKPVLIEECDFGCIDVFNTFTKMRKLCIGEGVGLSAVQVGLPWAMFVAKLDKGWRNFLNCEYIGLSTVRRQSIEGCLSLPNRQFAVLRHSRIQLTGQEMIVEKGEIAVKEIDEILTGFDAIVVQHEIDHQNGILISDIGREYVIN